MAPPALSREEAERRIRHTAERYALNVRRAYADAEETLISRVARRIARGIDSPSWEAQKLAEIRALRRDIEGELVKLRKVNKSIEEAIATSYDAGASKAVAELAGIADLAADTRFTRGSALRAISEAVANSLNATHLKILRATDDAYRDIITRAVSSRLAGGTNRRAAAQEALNEFADRGITGFVDRAGRSWDMASYVETATRTANIRAANEGHMDKLEANGYDLVIVGGSTESCPLCVPWEGKVLSLSGKSNEYPSVAQATESGLWHPNCTHSVGLYIPGTTPARLDLPSEQVRLRNYDERQKQRYLERGVRRWKKREAAAITDDQRQFARSKVREWQAKTREYVQQTGRRRDYGRESITRAR